MNTTTSESQGSSDLNICGSLVNRSDFWTDMMLHAGIVKRSSSASMSARATSSLCQAGTSPQYHIVNIS